MCRTRDLRGLPVDFCEGRIANFGAAEGDAAHICGWTLQSHPQRCHCGCCCPAAVARAEDLTGCHAPCRAVVSICLWPTSHSMCMLMQGCDIAQRLTARPDYTCSH